MPKFKNKRRFLTLLETLIAMTLLSFLLVIVFGLFRELASLQDLDKKEYKKTFYDNYIKLRFYDMFSQLSRESKLGTHFNFFTERVDNISSSPTLVFTFNNGVDKDPYQSSYIVGRLYLDSEKKELKLATWPVNISNPHAHFSQEVLYTNVESISFSFLSAPTDSPINPIEQRGQWQENWEKNYNEMPLLMQIHIKVEDDPEIKSFTFALPVRLYSPKIVGGG